MTGAGGRPSRHPLDLTLYLVTDTALCARAGLAATVGAAVRAGVTAVQVRDPGASDAELVRLGVQVRAALDGTGVPLLVNDRVHLVQEIGAHGAHIGQGDMPAPQARALLGDDAYLGLTVHDAAEVRQAMALPAGTVDYLGVGPVWATPTKPDHRAPGGLPLLRELSALSALPCVAIGGISAGRAALVRPTGVAGIAVVSAICGQSDVGAATSALRTSWARAS